MSDAIAQFIGYAVMAGAGLVIVFGGLAALLTWGWHLCGEAKRLEMLAAYMLADEGENGFTPPYPMPPAPRPAWAESTDAQGWHDMDGEAVTPQRLIAWLDTKFARLGEEEDKWAADYIRATIDATPDGASHG